MKTIAHAVIMAAGRGARMMPMTAHLPKPMMPFQGSTLIGAGIRRLKPHVPHIHVTVGYKGAMLAEHVIELGVDSAFNTEGHGNAWWLHHTLLAMVEGPTLVLTCDNVVELDVPLLLDEYMRVGQPACMVVPVTPVPGLDGDYLFLDGDTVTEIDRQARSDRYCSGIQVIAPSQVARLAPGCDDFYAIWRALIPQRQLAASRLYPKRWFAVDTPEQLAHANQMQE